MTFTPPVTQDTDLTASPTTATKLYLLILNCFSMTLKKKKTTNKKKTPPTGKQLALESNWKTLF